MRVLFLLLLFSLTSFAQTPGVVTPGGALKKRAYQTYAALTLFVDASLGSDSNACTASGTGACATLGAALQRVPIHIRHLVTVNVATGTYTEVFRMQGFFLESGNAVASTAGLKITGTQIAFTPATGSNTGTVSTYAPGLSTHPLLTDSTQTWTVNDLRGRYVTVTSGAGVGEYHLITSNTATQLSLADSFLAAPTAASIYAIQTPGPIFTGTGPTAKGMVGSGLVTLTDLSFQPASGFGFNVMGVTNVLTFTRIRVVGVSTGIFSNISGLGAQAGTGPLYWNLNQVYMTAGTNSAFNLPNYSQVNMVGIYARCTGSCGASGIRTGTAFSHVAAFSGAVEGNFGNGVAAQGLILLASSPGGGLDASEVYLDCGIASNVGVMVPVQSKHQANFIGEAWAGSNTSISNCGTGFSLNSTSTSYIDNSVYFNTVVNAIVVNGGARVGVLANPTFTGVTNQLTIDGTVFTDADLTTFTRITGPQGSYASRCAGSTICP